MSTNLYLIAHKVRGEPAFDIATKDPCFMCQWFENAAGEQCEPRWPQAECTECDGAGFLWTIPTSGHGAHPARWWPLTDLYDGDCSVVDEFKEHSAAAFDALPDHYPTRAAPTISLTEALGIRPTPLPPIKRRF